jgi:hypothetical protein
MSELEYIISLISAEIVLLEKYKYNLKKTAFKIVCDKEKNYSKQYYKIIDEVERVVLEIHNLEYQKMEYTTYFEIHKKKHSKS